VTGVLALRDGGVSYCGCCAAVGDVYVHTNVVVRPFSLGCQAGRGGLAGGGCCECPEIVGGTCVDFPFRGVVG
jgi:hypothetical protein